VERWTVLSKPNDNAAVGGGLRVETTQANNKEKKKSVEK
jgi:hypothetical protein